MLSLIWCGTVKVEFSLLGGLPRSRRFRHAIRDYEEGRLDDAAYTSIYLQELGRSIGIQNAFNYNIIIDGQIDWHDIFRPFSSSWRGVYPSSLLRYFDNNFFYRVPVFHSKPEPYSFFLARRARLLYGFLGKNETGKIVVPGPVTFSGLSKNETSRDVLWLAEKIAEALNIELRGVGEAHRFILQIDEPALSEEEVYARFKGELASIYSILLEGTGFSDVWLAVYFRAPPSDAYAELLDLKSIDMVSLDWVDDYAGVENIVREYGAKKSGLGLGVVDARDIYGENPAEVIERVSGIIDFSGSERVMLTTSTWLELLPLRYAAKKAGVLAEIAEILSGKMM